MRSIFVKEKSGFYALCPVQILDRHKRPFYYRNVAETACFNLPRGKYYINTPLYKLEEPINYKITDIPEIEKKFIIPEKLHLYFGKNPSKASILIAPGYSKILIDNSYRKAGKLILSFIIAHELGHHYYKREENADFAAYLYMINAGFNPSQIYAAANFTLNPGKSRERLTNIYNLTTKLRSI